MRQAERGQSILATLALKKTPFRPARDVALLVQARQPEWPLMKSRMFPLKVEMRMSPFSRSASLRAKAWATAPPKEWPAKKTWPSFRCSMAPFTGVPLHRWIFHRLRQAVPWQSSKATTFSFDPSPFSWWCQEKELVQAPWMKTKVCFQGRSLPRESRRSPPLSP